MLDNNTFSYCPVCGGRAIECTRLGDTSFVRKWTCNACGFDLYNNVASSVAIIMQDGEGNILLLERAKEPRSGYMALPGGFVDPDEGLEEAAMRECMEETHFAAERESIHYLCSFPNDYTYRGIHYKTCDSFWIVHLKGISITDVIPTLVRQEKEVRRFASYPCRSAQDVDDMPLAFDSARRALHYAVSHSL